MRTEETLLLQALKLKELNHRACSGVDLVDHLLTSNPDFAKEKMRNICAFITPELFQDVDGLCNLLSISKREVVEMALQDFMEKASKIIDETKAFPGQEH